MTNNNRAENRIQACEVGEVTILGHPDVTVKCHIRDFSRFGMCILVDRQIPRDQIVKVQWDSHFLVGRVQRSADLSGIYQIGLELLQCSKWKEPVVYMLA